jgi:hypothetical protein
MVNCYGLSPNGIMAGHNEGNRCLVSTGLAYEGLFRPDPSCGVAVSGVPA